MNSTQSIAERAYEMWIARGRPRGSGEVDWLEAERQLASEERRRANRDNVLQERVPKAFRG
jgi:hypothetical protein